MLRLVLTMVLFGSLPASAQKGPGPGPGPAEALVVSATAGDAACHLILRDSAGRQSNWQAAFELCEEKGVRAGQRYAFRWEAGDILHPSCQGNMDCGRSLRVMLAVEARPARR